MNRMLIHKFVLISLPLLVVNVAVYADIGRVTFSKGSVSATLQSKSRTLRRGSDLFNGDEIKTGANSSAKLRFSDSSIVDLRSNTDFVVKNYLFSKAGTSSRFNAKLLKGGLSTVTGGIARLNRAGYRVEVGQRNRKPVAVIAVRGTMYRVAYVPSTGAVRLSLLAGKLSVNNVRISAGDVVNFNAAANRMTITNAAGVTRAVSPAGDLEAASEELGIDKAEQEVAQAEKNLQDQNEGEEAGSTASGSGSAGEPPDEVLIDSGGGPILVPYEDVGLYTGEATAASAGFASGQNDALDGDEYAP